MINAKIGGDIYGTGLALTNKKKGIFESVHQSTVSCFVCIECGYIELKADKPKNLIIWQNKVRYAYWLVVETIPKRI